jgi:hypothetical protein
MEMANAWASYARCVTSDELIERLVAAYRPHIRERLEGLGIEAPPGLARALREGEAWLRQALTELLARPFADQARGPLEVFQEAMRFPTRALEEVGVPPARRDPAAREALPGDLYDLAPASSSSLGEEVWRAHLAWGAEKARAVAPLVREAPARQSEGPRVVAILSGNLIDRSRIEQAVVAAGFRPVAGGESSAPALALVDLAHPQAEPFIEELAGAGVPTVAFGPHVDENALDRASALGARSLPRSRFFRSLPELLAEAQSILGG